MNKDGEVWLRMIKYDQELGQFGQWCLSQLIQVRWLYAQGSLWLKTIYSGDYVVKSAQKVALSIIVFIPVTIDKVCALK